MRIKFIFITLIFLTFIHCKEDPVENDSKTVTTEKLLADDDVYIVSSSNQRLDIVNRAISTTVPSEFLSQSNPLSAISSLSEVDEVTNFEAAVHNAVPDVWFMAANVKAPILNGETLSSSHCAIRKDRAYVSYMGQGNKNIGMVDVIDITNPGNPKLINEIKFDSADINALTVDNEGILWLAASHKDFGATVYRVDLFVNKVQRVNLSNSLEKNRITASANGITFTNNYIIVSAGKTYGGTFIINKNSLKVEYVDSYPNAKYVGVNDISDKATYVSLTTGESSELRKQTVADFNPAKSFTIDDISHRNVEETNRGKNTLTFNPLNPDRVFVAMGKNGVKSFDLNSGRITNESIKSMLTTGNSNAITMDSKYIYMANGADGVSVGLSSIKDDETINPFFHWDLEETNASANFVIAQDDWIFVCKGKGGFNILHKRTKDNYMSVSPYNSFGTPLAFDTKQPLCSEFLPNFFKNILPEGQNAMKHNPEYFKNQSKNIWVKDRTKVYVTFLHDGAGYRNTLGYYAYKKDNPPKTVKDLVKIVIFPNASEKDSGGELIPGNTVRLLGEFDKDTMIGFFLISNGWNGRITEGLGTQHTDIFLNSNEKQQSLIFHDPKCNTTVIAFEDIRVPDGDNDFNDAIFQINASSNSAIDTEEYIQIKH